jgi:multiple sugar transport system ATP-binding protein
MDEPLSNLDAKLRGEMRTELKRLHSDTNSTFVYVTHDQLEAMTLSTKVCLMETGVLQQYDPPLTIYNQPANMFVASFVGNPTMNFIPANVEQADGQTLQLEILGKKAVLTADEPFTVPGVDVVAGIRPEFLPIRKDGPLEASIYSTLPAGMETTVRLKCGETQLTSVVFGSVDYAVDEIVRMDVTGDSIVLFGAEDKKRFATGKLEIRA